MNIARIALISVVVPATLPAQTSRPNAATIAAAIDTLASRAVAAGLSPALGVAVTMDGKTIYARSHGMADATAGVRADDRTLWYLASTTKSFTGFAASLLANDGVIRFDTPITQLIPKARWHADVRAEQLTLARFLSHTHHINDNAVVMNAAFTGAIPEDKWPELAALGAPDGTNDLIYTNFGYNVTAMVIDAKRGEGWRKFLDTRVHAPAGMTNTFTRVSGIDAKRIARAHALRADGSYAASPFLKTDVTMNSAGGHMATLADLARWTIVQMDSGRIDGRQVFPKEAVVLSQTMIAPQTRDQAKRFAFFQREGWGAGWDIGTYEGERMVSRFGSYDAFRSHLSFLPRRRIGFVAISTGGVGSNVTDILAAYAYDLEVGRPEATTRAKTRIDDLIARLPSVRQSVASGDSTRAARQKVALRHPLADYAGRYFEPNYGEVVFTFADGKLSYKWGAQYGPVEIYDASRDQLRLEIAGSGDIASFEFGGSGPASGVTIRGARFTRR